MWMPVSDVSEETGQCGATCLKREVRRGVEGGGHCEVAVDSAQKTPTANRDPGSTFSPTRSKRRRLRQKRAGSVRLVGSCGEAPPPSEDELFRHKCLELQRYVHPLESILQRLKSGQFSRRLSSLQQDVAVERIQRIMAMLQNPNMGGSFLTNIQKLEGMLKSWFPHVSPTLNQVDHDVLAKRRKSYTSSSPQEVTQVNAVSSSTDCLRKRGHPMDTPLRPALQGLPFTITSPCLERLLQAKDSIVAPPVREVWSCHDVRAVTEDR